MTETEQSVLVAPDGREIRLQIWRPRDPATHIVQIVHGLGEYSDRYIGFATAATARGCIVACHDHRGHGGHAEKLGHFGDSNGWNNVVNDVHAVNGHLHARFSALPLVLLGHSMGSYIAQAYAMRHATRLDALILSASTAPSRVQLRLACLLAKFEGIRIGRQNNSALLHKLGFGNFNKAFRPARTEMDWLSREHASVDRYIADPLCGGPYSCGLWQDLISGLLAISARFAPQQIPQNLPILISGGCDDPVGGESGMTTLARRYAQSGHQKVKLKIYPGGRHEMLHETNRADVMRDWMDWIMQPS